MFRIVALFVVVIIAAAPFAAVSFAYDGESSGPVQWPVPSWKSAPGAWLTQNPLSSYNMSGGNYNPYSTAPNTSHILWRVPFDIGGAIEGQDAVSHPWYRHYVAANGIVYLGEG